MISVNPLEYLNAFKTLYAKCVGPVCQKHGITRMELDILFFLANNPCFDTAADMVERRFLSKSQVSASVRLLSERGCLRKEYQGNNRKTAHLRICDAALEIVADGRKAQESFFSIMVRGIPREELDGMRRCMECMQKNIKEYL